MRPHRSTSLRRSSVGRTSRSLTPKRKQTSLKPRCSSLRPTHRYIECCASPNIALIKYWGKSDIENNLPLNSSISLTLNQSSTFKTLTRVWFSDDKTYSLFILNGKVQEVIPDSINRVIMLFQTYSQNTNPIIIQSTNYFPTSSGMASSASGLAALTTALSHLYDTPLTPKQLSAVARFGSGSAGRSITGPAVLLSSSPAEPHPAFSPLILSYSAQPIPLHPDIAGMHAFALAVVPTPKPIGSTQAMLRCQASPLMRIRLKAMPGRIHRAKMALATGDFDALAKEAEADWRCMHTIIEDTVGSYLTEQSHYAVKELQRFNAEQSPSAGPSAFVTFDAGPNPIIFSRPGCTDAVRAFCTGLAATLGATLMDSALGNGAIVSEKYMESPKNPLAQ
eukprot:gnl/Dysnectes_brevis/871_a964_1295.p1 GENE.gnl/Dysnectes_brevis/871_a964_1295~~gnl/Dysnectes_brevis/871_a964_1295.p1  ORF type:complete len:393 (-),score=99.23 gnl/Dysnectes_brevis/871_a964_1295:127-1305(-)